MGTYYKMCSLERKESIDPRNIDNLGCKRYSIAHPDHPFGQIVIFALLNKWRGSTTYIVDDVGEHNDEYHNFKDVTEVIINEYNKEYDTNLKFTNGDDI